MPAQMGCCDDPDIGSDVTQTRRAGQPAISSTDPDWSRESKRWFEWAPSRSLLASLRRYQRHAGRRNPWHRLVARVAVLQHCFWSVVTGADVPIICQIKVIGGVHVHDLAVVGIPARVAGEE